MKEIADRQYMYLIKEYKPIGEGIPIKNHYAVNRKVAGIIAKQIEKNGNSVLIFNPEKRDDIFGGRKIVYSTPKPKLNPIKGKNIRISPKMPKLK